MTKPTDTVEVLEHPTPYHFNYRESLWNVTKISPACNWSQLIM